MSRIHLRWECFRAWLAFVEQGYAASCPVTVEANASTLRLQDMAKQAKVSVSTLRRRLEQTQGGFRLARRRALADVAVGLLRDNQYSVESIAEQLGYADARSFRRFLKGATGRTPQDFRGDDMTVDSRLIMSSNIHDRIRGLASVLSG